MITYLFLLLQFECLSCFARCILCLFCRFLCPLGGLFGLFSRFVPWRIGKTSDRCGDCRICEEYCEGACRPSGRFIGGECVMCMNCLDRCPAGRVTFATRASAAGEAALPDLSRRGLIMAGGGLLLASMSARRRRHGQTT